MSINQLFSILKGGSGSGNFGHSGRPGKRGGSGGFGVVGISNDMSKVSFDDYLNVYGLEKSGIKVSKPIYINSNDLPKVKSGDIRIFHGTQISSLESIDKIGLKTGKEIDSRERLPNILGVANKPSSFGEVSVVYDLPKDKVRMINDEWTETGSVDKKYIKGYVINKIPLSRTEFGDAIKRFRDLGGNI